jgi:hypothetical protein
MAHLPKLVYLIVIIKICSEIRNNESGKDYLTLYSDSTNYSVLLQERITEYAKLKEIVNTYF